MSKSDECSFRESFAAMASQAIINRAELASLLSTSIGAISQMGYRGELPQTAFPSKRRACWFVGDIRSWLEEMARSRPIPLGELNATSASKTGQRIGRPRLSTLKAK
jgi:hypothetical protein